MSGQGDGACDWPHGVPRLHIVMKETETKDKRQSSENEEADRGPSSNYGAAVVVLVFVVVVVVDVVAVVAVVCHEYQN